MKHVSGRKLSAFVVQSLSQSSHIVVDTRSDPVPTIEAIYYDESILIDNKTHYSSGHNIIIVVKFTSEIVLRPGTMVQENLVVPSLSLNSIDRDGQHSKAILLNNQEFQPKTKLLFTYVVNVNSTQSFYLSTRDAMQLSLNDYSIVDLWNRNASLVLPESTSNCSLVASKAIILHNQNASIQSIEVLTKNGKYGSGEAIDFEVAFSHEVTTNGYPELQINVQSLIAKLELIKMGTSLSKSYFYIWYISERSDSIPWDATSTFLKQAIENIPSVVGQVCVSRSQNASKNGFIWLIRFDSIYDDFRKGFYVETATVSLDHESSIFSVSFEQMNYFVDEFKDDSYKDFSCLYRSAKYLFGAGTKKFRFRYDVLPGDTSDGLALAPIPFHKTISSGNILTNSLNDATSSSIAVDVENFQTVNMTWNLSIDTTSPRIVDMSVNTSSSGYDVLHAGDELFLTFEFDQAVEVQGTPTIPLDVRPSGKANYVIHSGNFVIFSYRVGKEHWSSDIFNEHISVSINLENEASIKRSSTSPVTDADVTIPWSNFYLSEMNIAVDGRIPRVDSLEIISSTSEFVVGTGDAVFIQVRFTTPVVIWKGPPVLIVSIGGELSEALYESGNMTSILIFSYEIKTGDSNNSSMKCHLLCISTGCLYGASAEGYLMQMSSNPKIHASLMLPFGAGESYDAC